MNLHTTVLIIAWLFSMAFTFAIGYITSTFLTWSIIKASKELIQCFTEESQMRWELTNALFSEYQRFKKEILSGK